MGELINGRCPAEIKSGLRNMLETCADISGIKDTICQEMCCPYDDDNCCHETILMGALALIERLESEHEEFERLESERDVAPVVHARWNEEDGTCSACYHEACYDEWTEPKWDYDWDENLVQTGEETHIQFIFSPYCPNCGARMDGEADAV